MAQTSDTLTPIVESLRRDGYEITGKSEAELREQAILAAVDRLARWLAAERERKEGKAA